MKKYLLACFVGLLMFAALLYYTDDPHTAHFIEIGEWRWQIDRRYLWNESTPIDPNELDRMLDIAGPNSVIMVSEDGTLYFQDDDSIEIVIDPSITITPFVIDSGITITAFPLHCDPNKIWKMIQKNP